MRYDLDNQNALHSEIAHRHHWIRGTDVQHVWRKHGWVPPSEYRRDFQLNSLNYPNDTRADRQARG